MAVLKVLELMADSDKSWEDATRKAVEKASDSVKNVRSVWIKEQTVTVQNGKISSYRITAKVTFEVE